MPVYIWKRKDCEEYVEVTSSMEDRDAWRMTQENPDEWERVYQLPNVRTRISTTFVDGVVPQNRKDEFKVLKESYRLESKSYDLPPEKRKDVNKEITKMRKT